MKVVFILGCGHSGSTLLDLLLDGYPQIFGVGELERSRAEATCTCGLPAPECPIWSKALGPLPWPRREVYRSKWSFLFDRGTYLSASTFKPIDEREFLSSTISAYRAVLAASGKSIIVDSSAQTDRAELLSSSPEIEPYFIHLVRDGRGATWSYLRKYKKMIPFFFIWFSANMKIEILKRRRKNFLFMRYEDLVENPARELARVCILLNIPYEPQMLKFRENEHHQIEGNRMRFAHDDIRKDEKWRRDMPRSLRVLFDICFGWLNMYYNHKHSI